MIMLILVEHIPRLSNWVVLQNTGIFLGDSETSVRVKLQHFCIMPN
jgi:hypothetical protein